MSLWKRTMDYLGLGPDDAYDDYDGYDEPEQLPRRFRYTFGYKTDEEGVARVVMRGEDETQLGDGLTDNAFDQDGYRFHDVLHLSHAALLGSAWAAQGVFTLFAVLFVFVGAQFIGLGLLGDVLPVVAD